MIQIGHTLPAISTDFRYTVARSHPANARSDDRLVNDESAGPGPALSWLVVSGRDSALADLQLVDDPFGGRLVDREVGERHHAHRDRVGED